MPADFNHVRFVMPKFSKSSYNALMKTFNNSLAFDVSDTVQYRFHILSHFYQYGLKPTLDAFGIKKSILYVWKKAYEASGKKASSLIPKSTCPKQTRTMVTDWRMETFIRTLREDYGPLSKYKIKPFLDEYAKSLGIASYGTSKIGKIIKKRNYFFDKGINAKSKKRRKWLYLRLKKTPKADKPGYIEMDSITLYFLGKKNYFITAIDIFTKYAWCKLVISLSSIQARLALEEFRDKFPYEIKEIQTDNGSEFLNEFHLYLEEQKIHHNFIYPHSPKINGVIERFNRTIQDEFLNRNDLFGIDQNKFNQDLLKYLVWYNNQRPHHTLKLVSPITFINNLKMEG
jgi:hypothetical protein